MCASYHNPHLENLAFNKNRYHLIIFCAMCGILRLWTQPQLLSECDDSIFLSHQAHPSQILLLYFKWDASLRLTAIRWLNIDTFWLILWKVLKSRRNFIWNKLLCVNAQEHFVYHKKWERNLMCSFIYKERIYLYLRYTLAFIMSLKGFIRQSWMF